MDDNRKRLTVRLEPALWQKLRKEAFKREEPVNSLIEIALDVYLRRPKQEEANGVR
jgi:hypothetical protein